MTKQIPLIALSLCHASPSADGEASFSSLFSFE